jgi:hypothetical protein
MTIPATSTEEKKTSTKFHFFSLQFTPLVNSQHSSSSILHAVVTYLQQQKLQEKGVLIDRHDRRVSNDRRELFMTQSVLIPGKKIRFTLALLRTGKVPLLKPSEKFQLVPLDKTKGEIAEQTSFFIDYSKSKIILCVEYNYYGPRASDIEFYLRSIAHNNLHIAKATEMEVFMERSIERTIEDLKNVLSMDIKLQPKNLIHLDHDVRNTYFTGMSNLGELLKPKFIKLQTNFQYADKSGKSLIINSEANSMFTKLLERFKGRPFNMDAFDNFVVKYEDKDGMEQIFNLLKGKYEIDKDLSDKELHNSRLMFVAIENEISDFMKNIHA